MRAAGGCSPCGGPVPRVSRAQSGRGSPGACRDQLDRPSCLRRVGTPMQACWQVMLCTLGAGQSKHRQNSLQPEPSQLHRLSTLCRALETSYLRHSRRWGLSPAAGVTDTPCMQPAILKGPLQPTAPLLCAACVGSTSPWSCPWASLSLLT